MNCTTRTPALPCPPAWLHRLRFYVLSGRGFTLLELIIVLVILSVASGLVGVLVFSGSGNLELKRVTKHIAATLRYGRNRAVSEKKVYSFIVWGDERAYGLYADIPPEADFDESNPLVLKKLPDSLFVMIEGDEENQRIDFTPRGDSSGGTLEVRGKKENRFLIVVNRITGRVAVSSDEKDR